MLNIDSKLIYDNKLALDVIGSIANDLNLIRDRDCILKPRDFEDNFHRNMFSILQNIALEKDIKEIDGFSLDSYIKNYPDLHQQFTYKNGITLIDTLKESSKNTSFEYSSKMLVKFSLLRRFNDVGMDISELFQPHETNLEKYTERYKKLEKCTTEDIKNYFREKMIEIDIEYANNTDAYSFKGGEGLRNLIQKCRTAPKWGKSFQSGLFNAVFRGMQGSKLMIRSAGTGGGK